jgi:hypothetical protein
VPRRVGLPGASGLVRLPDDGSLNGANEKMPPRGTGRIRHDEKITVYVSREELLALEQARLMLRARHGMAIDRGRIVREALSATLADFSVNGGESELVRRLSNDHDRQWP